MIRTLTQRLKTVFLPLLVKRDSGINCWYCKMPLSIFKHIYEHLNDNREDNRIENIVLACSSCNNKKTNDPEMKRSALEKLFQNETSNYLCERKISKADPTQETPKEIEINVSNYEIVEKYISESVKTDGSILYKQALHSCTYLCKQKTGHGSQNCVRNYVSALTSEVGPYEIIQDDNNKKIIVVRKGK